MEYQTEEERKAARRESQRKWREANPEYARKHYQDNKAAILERCMKYRETHKDKIAESKRKYYNTPMGRASHLLSTYRRMDIRNGFGDCIDFDAQWIVDNIFTQKCAHCDCTDWHKLGCNRIDNSKPHTIDNVEPCCWKHNLELAAAEKAIPVAQYDKVSGELIAVWSSAYEIERQLGFAHQHINKCCNGRYKSAYGYRWGYYPL